MATKQPLMEIIAEMIDQSDRSEHYFRRLYRLGVQGARKFNYDIYGTPITVLLDVSANGIVNWPCDYLDYFTLGIINECGEMVPLKHNEELSLVRQQYLASQQAIVPVPTAPNGIVNSLQNPQGYPFFWLNYQYGDIGWVHLYGLGGGAPSVGEFTVDPNNKCFYVPPYFPYQTILLEYLSDGFAQDCNDYMVDIFAVDALKWWVRWQDAVGLPKRYSMGQVKEYKAEYLIQRRDAKFRINHARVSEMTVIARNNIKLTAKA